MIPIPFSTRESWLYYIFAVLVTSIVLCRKQIQTFLYKAIAIDILKKEKRGKFPFKIQDMKNRSKKDIERTLFPPSHPGGNPGREAYKWAFTELIETRQLSKPEAWEEYKKKFPNPVYEKDPLLEQNDRGNFYKAMSRHKKKAKKGDKTTRK